jgi:uncharacterized protein (TIGR03435 family)
MNRAIAATLWSALAGGLAFGQTPDPLPKFEAADVHVSAKTQTQFARTSPVRAGRYEVKTASMADLVRIAYAFDMDKIVGGPSWLELDRFDVTAKVPAESTPEMHKQMLQSLLAERFKLVTHKETRPLPTYSLVAKKPNLKEAAGTEDTGCHPQQASGAPTEGGIRLMSMSANGQQTTINLGPGMTVTYQCRNVTMETFASSLRTMMGANLPTTNAVVDETGLKGKFNFDFKYSMSMFGPMPSDPADRIPMQTALEKQLGLKLEEKQTPTPVIVVDSVERKPTENPPGTAEALPPLPVPTAFEVASIKPSSPDVRMSRMTTQPGGRLVIDGLPLSFVLSRAFNTFNNDEIVGIPPFAQNDRYDIVAKIPGSAGAAPGMDMEVLGPLIVDLLKERFGLKYHKDEREMTAYSLVAAKPKMKKADPNSRTNCKNPNPPPGAPSGSRLLVCQNVTMAYLAERLQRMTPELSWPIADNTGLEGGWDLSLTFSQRPMMMMPARPPEAGGGAGMAGGGGGAPMPAAAEPTGGQTIFEAIEKQLGLKLEKGKRSLPVIVIDHLEQKPTEN